MFLTMLHRLCAWKPACNLHAKIQAKELRPQIIKKGCYAWSGLRVVLCPYVKPVPELLRGGCCLCSAKQEASSSSHSCSMMLRSSCSLSRTADKLASLSPSFQVSYFTECTQVLLAMCQSKTFASHRHDKLQAKAFEQHHPWTLQLPCRVLLDNRIVAHLVTIGQQPSCMYPQALSMHQVSKNPAEDFMSMFALGQECRACVSCMCLFLPCQHDVCICLCAGSNAHLTLHHWEDCDARALIRHLYA